MEVYAIGFFLSTFALGFVVIHEQEKLKKFKADAVSRGVAEHDSATGEWRWKDETPGTPSGCEK